ncbi:MAG: efflux RND transporter periplasmic adaptor subunit [Candidatus Moranbacteria bacterium]|nr:efflux RND transporter periplasmic adaptor subunit [Candidatus Moranbacteria bacterium]
MKAIIKKHKKKIFYTLGILIFIIGIYFIFFKKDTSSELEYDVEKVIKGNIQVAISVDGSIIFDTWNMEFLNPGTVENIYVNLGDIVNKNKVLASSDSSYEDNKIAQSKADLESSRLNSERLSEEGVDYKIKKDSYKAAKEKEDNEDDLYDKYVELYGKDSSQALAQKTKKDSAEADIKNAKKQLEQVEESYQNSKYQLEKSQASYVASKEAYDKYEITSPVDNVLVAQINGTIGSVVGGDKTSSEPFIVLVDPESFWFESYVEDVEALQIESGMKTYVELDAYPDQQFEGEVIFVSPVAELDSNDLASYKVIISVKEIDEKFLSDMAGSADLISKEVRDVLIISSEAVRDKGGKKIVIVKTENGFENREVTTGFTNLKEVEIKSGLKVGEEVIIVK